MKKVMYLCLMVAVMPFVACSIDDDNGTGQDPIVGKWYQIEERQIVNGEETSSWMNACEKMDNFDIKNDGTILSTYYYRDSNDECQKDGSENIDWTVTVDGAYTFTYIDDDGYTTEVKLEGETLTETYTYTSGDSSIQDIHVYSMTPDESGDDQGVEQDQLIGKWRESKSTEKSFENGEYVDTKVTETTTKEYFELDFKADGTFTEFVSEVYLSNGDSGEEIVETSTSGGIYELKGDKIVITYPPNEDGEEAEVLEMPYSVSANTLTIISIDEYSYNNIDYKDETTIEFHRL